jgi:hypothetical protein
MPKADLFSVKPAITPLRWQPMSPDKTGETLAQVGLLAQCCCYATRGKKLY